MNIILFSDSQDSLSEKESKDSGKWCFYKEDARYLHIKKILKLKECDIFKAGKINGKIGEAKILLFDNEKLIFSFEEKKSPSELPNIKILLGFPRPIQLKRILRDIASLGFSELFLIGTELGEASYLKSSLSNNKSIKKYLIDGISQAGQTLLPEFYFFPSVGECLKNKNFFLNSKKILLDTAKKAQSLSKLKIQNNETVVMAIGSERGWTNAERDIFKQTEFSAYSMGERILRTETASTAALSVILDNLGHWK